MGKNNQNEKNIDSRSRFIKCLIYLDNPEMKQLFDTVVSGGSPFDHDTKFEWISIKHQGFDGGKEHFHLYFRFANPMRISSLCRRFGYFTDTGEPDDQFVRCITGKNGVRDALLYLTHLNAPDKEQYSDSNLRGSPDLIADYHKFALNYLSKKIDKRDAFKQASDWISSQVDIISAKDMVAFLISHECFVIRHESWLRSLWFEHNSRLAYIARKEVSEQISKDAEKWAELLNGVNEKIMPDEWFEINGGGMF